MTPQVEERLARSAEKAADAAQRTAKVMERVIAMCDRWLESKGKP